MARTLELRPLPYIGAAYLVGAVAGPAADVIGSLAWTFAGDLNLTVGQQAVITESIRWIVDAVPLCLAGEVVVATPLLIGFARYRWRWLNGMSGAALGLVAGAAFGVLALMLSPPVMRESIGLIVVVAFAIAGAASALTIRLIGVREVRPRSAATAHVFD